jgi:ribosome-binding factor A
MDVKHTPEIHFVYNSQYEDESKITQLLKDSSDEAE